MKCDGYCCRSACAMEKGHEGECRCGSPLGPDHMLPGQQMPEQVSTTLNQRLLAKSGAAYEWSPAVRVITVRDATNIGNEFAHEAVKEAEDRASEDFKRRRGIRGTPCDKCGGWGARAYGSTSLWRGGTGGQAITTGICDKCWGSGDAEFPGIDLRMLERGGHPDFMLRPKAPASPKTERVPMADLQIGDRVLVCQPLSGTKGEHVVCDVELWIPDHPKRWKHAHYLRFEEFSLGYDDPDELVERVVAATPGT